jgi:hypothetical protein
MKNLLILVSILMAPATFAIQFDGGGGGGHHQGGGGNPGCGCPSGGNSGGGSGDCSAGVAISGIVNINSKGRFRPYIKCEDGNVQKVVCLYENGGIFYGNYGASIYPTNTPDGMIRGIENAHLKKMSGYRKIYLADQNYRIIQGRQLGVESRLDRHDYFFKDRISDFSSIDIDNSANLAEVIEACNRLARDYGFNP